jgi:hypothetical protein
MSNNMNVNEHVNVYDSIFSSVQDAVRQGDVTLTKDTVPSAPPLSELITGNLTTALQKEDSKKINVEDTVDITASLKALETSKAAFLEASSNLNKPETTALLKEIYI